MSCLPNGLSFWLLVVRKFVVVYVKCEMWTGMVCGVRNVGRVFMSIFFLLSLNSQLHWMSFCHIPKWGLPAISPSRTRRTSVSLNFQRFVFNFPFRLTILPPFHAVIIVLHFFFRGFTSKIPHSSVVFHATLPWAFEQLNMVCCMYHLQIQIQTHTFWFQFRQIAYPISMSIK